MYIQSKMGRIMAIDFGLKRCGIAVTDTLQIIATPLETIDSKQLDSFLKKYCDQEVVDTFVIGHPRQLDGTDNYLEANIQELKKYLGTTYPLISTVLIDERYTSKIAVQSMHISGMKKKERQKKENIDLISAVLILQTYMQTLNK